MTGKRDAYEFLESLRLKLERDLPGSEEMRKTVESIVESAATEAKKKHLTSREHAFINAIATPLIFEAIAGHPGMNTEKARESFLTESYRNLPEFSRATPARRLRHPFNKELNTDAAKIYEQWSGVTKKRPLTQSCPDFAIREPFPHTIVFDAKYYLSPSETTAKRELVTNAYQAFFYRALPRDHTSTSRPDWDYEYSCLFAYDASKNAVLKNAWEQLSSDVNRGFWEGANVYIMVLRGNEI